MGTTDKKEKEDVKAEETKEVKEEKKDPATLTLEDVREHCRLLERSVVSKESRFAVRVLRGLPATRKKLTGNILKRIITGFYTHSATERDALLSYIPDDVSLCLSKRLKTRLIIHLFTEHGNGRRRTRRQCTSTWSQIS